MNQNKRVGIYGCGKMGEAVLQILFRGGHRVRVWDKDEQVRKHIADTYGSPLLAASIEELVLDAHMIFLGVPAPAIVLAAEAIGPFVNGSQIVLHAARGVGPEFLLPHQVIRQKTCIKKIGVLGGPLYFEDLTDQRPLTAILASRYDEVARFVRELTEETQVRLHTCRDVVGVEIAGAISNVSALAAGMSQHLSLGETAQGVLLTHGLSESAQLGVAKGAEWITFTGLAGVGDLIPRTVASTERHYEAGRALARGETLGGDSENPSAMLEGVCTAYETHAYASVVGLRLPLIAAVHAVLCGEKKAKEALEEVLNEDITLGRDLVSKTIQAL